ncbi:MAG: heparan-alpha-glucosaminide N-acetyltransferase domain-containing protein [Gemmatimonadales bacterium]
MTAAAVGTRSRLDSVDLLRGIIMILMAIDHTRDFFGDVAANPTNPATTTLALFFTRWITHFCAPVFFLLTGTGARLSLRRKSKSELAHFLWTRGLWLIALETVLVRCLGWQWNFDFRTNMLTVLWALGWAMIVLSALLRLPNWAITAFGAVLVVGHNLLDDVTPAAFGSLAPLWTMLHSPGFVYNGGEHVIFAAYVLIPWVGVTALGYSLGAVFELDTERRRAILLRLGLAGVAAFLVLRFINVYGDPSRWSTQATPLFTGLSFLNTSKYPPSLLFLLMTLGPAMLALRVLDRGTPRWLRPALVFGRVPMFYYIGHVILLHAIALALSQIRFGAVHWVFESPTIGNFPITQPEGWPLPLPWVYLIWACVVVTLYPLCRWFAALKQRRRDVWLSYL